MNTRLQFGQRLGFALNVKTAAGGAKGTAGVVNSAINWLMPAAKPAGRAAAGVTPPPLPVPAGTTRAGLERTTGRILDAGGRPVPMKAPPPVPGPPPGRVTISPAEAAAGRATVRISPEEVAGAAPAMPPRATPRDNQADRAMTLLRAGGLRGM